MKSIFQNIYDISVTLGRESIDYPGDTVYRRELVSSIKEGRSCNLSSIQMSCHSGTHLDAPSHFIANGKSIDDFPVERFIFNALVVEIQSPVAITRQEIEGLSPSPGSALLFKTRNSRSGICRNGTFCEDFVYLSPEAAHLCAAWQLSLVGVDYITAEKYDAHEFVNHQLLLAREIFILEGVDLNEVEPGAYTLICMPLKISGGDGAPTRAILMS